MSYDGTAGRPVLVTGAAGFIGSALVAALMAHGHEVVAVDHDRGGLDRLAGTCGATGLLTLLPTDITNSRTVRDAVDRVRPGAIVHLAALHIIPECEARPQETVAVNVDGVRNVLDAADRSATEFVLFASTADVYAPSACPLAEDDPTGPASVYGASKLLGERLLTEWADRRPHRRATVMRIFNVYGPGDGNPHVIPDILRRLQDSDEIQVGNTDAQRDFIHVEDLADIMRRVLESADPPPLVNVGSGRATSVAALLDTLARLRGRPITWTSDPARMRTIDRPFLQAETSLLRSLDPDLALRSLDTGLADLLMTAGLLRAGERQRAAG